MTVTLIASAAVSVVTIVGATVALCLGQIDQATFAALVGPLAGVGVGAGAHAAGVRSAAV